MENEAKDNGTPPPLIVGGSKLATRDHESVVNAILFDTRYVITNAVIHDPDVSDAMLAVIGRSMAGVLMSGVICQLDADENRRFLEETFLGLVSGILPEVLCRARAEAVTKKSSPALFLN